MLSLLLLATLVPLYNISNVNNSEAAGNANDSTITFESTRLTASVDLVVASTSGTFATSSSSNQAAFSITTNNSQGYTLTLESSASGTGATDLTNSTSGASLSTIASSSISDNFSVGTWGLLPSSYKSGETVTNNNSTTYFPAPTSGNALTLDSTSSANSSSAKSYTIGIGAKADFSLASGTYTKAETYTIAYVANPTNYAINYNQNTTDTVTNMPATTTNSTSETSIILSNTVPIRSGYDFLGWCSVETTSDGSTDSCSDTIYNPNGAGTNLSFGIDRTTSNVTTLYAMWAATLIDLGYMQDLGDNKCQVNVGTNGNPANIGDQFIVHDKRDNKDYTARWINGQCWMTQNLRYLGDTGSADKTMTIGDNNSNASNKSITLYSLNKNDAGNFNSYSDSYCNSINGYNYACVYSSGSTSTGVWYNYYAASAGTVTTSFNSTAASNDICPKNWHLPTGLNTASNTDLNKLVGNTTSGWQAATTGLTAFGAVAGGFYVNGAPVGDGRYTQWWSATTDYNANRYSLEYDSSNGQFNGNTRIDRYYGVFVRCVYQPHYSLTVNADSNVTALTLKAGGTSGPTITGTKSGNTFTFTDLGQGNQYYLYPTFASGYEFNSWTKSDSVSDATLSSTTTANPYYTIGSSNGILTLSSKASGPYIQDFTLTSCRQNVGTNGNASNVGDTITVYDQRDGKNYTVRYINGYCWMTQNLRFTGTSVTTATSNVTSDKTLTYYDLAGSEASSTTGHCYGYATSGIAPQVEGEGFNNACIHDSGSTDTGVWYNYYAASVGTISGASNSTIASQDICPKNWHLPTGGAHDSTSEFYKLYNSDTAGFWIATNDYLTAFGAIGGGSYYAGSLRDPAEGQWWSATQGVTWNRFTLRYNSDDNQFWSSTGMYRDLPGYRYIGVFVRCVRTS